MEDMLIFSKKKLKNKIQLESFKNLKDAMKRVFELLDKAQSTNKTLLFSPCAASFDSFKNFEDRGLYFDKLVKKYLNGR